MRRIKQMMMFAMLAALLCGCGAKKAEAEPRPADDRPEENISAPEEESSSEESAPEAVEESLLSSVFASAKPGNELQFGTYEQDNNLSNGAEPIEWIVLANEGDKIFVLSKYMLDTGDIVEWTKTVTWATSEEREWLNSTFYEDVFSEEEKRCILKSDISTPDTEGTISHKYDQPFYSYGGADTSDFLFFLSYDEVVKYVQPLGIAGAIYRGMVNDNVYGGWLMRSPGTPPVSDWPDDDTVKAIAYAGGFCAVNPDGSFYIDTAQRLCSSQGWIRPAMWLKVQ